MSRVDFVGDGPSRSLWEIGVPNNSATLIKGISGGGAADIDFTVKRSEVGLDACDVGFPDYVGGFGGLAFGEAGHGAVAVYLRPLILVLAAIGGCLNLKCKD